MKTVILNRSKLSKKVPMNKTTHTIPDIEKLMLEKYTIITNKDTTKAQKNKARVELNRLEEHVHSINEKHINGKKYNPAVHLYDPRPQTKKEKEELLKLIDSVETIKLLPEECEGWRDKGVNLSGVYTKLASEEV